MNICYVSRETNSKCLPYALITIASSDGQIAIRICPSLIASHLISHFIIVCLCRDLSNLAVSQINVSDLLMIQILLQSSSHREMNRYVRAQRSGHGTSVLFSRDEPILLKRFKKIFDCGEIQRISYYILIIKYWTFRYMDRLLYVITYGNYKLLKAVRSLAHPVCLKASRFSVIFFSHHYRSINLVKTENKFIKS